jgi:hypothetical protein
MRHASFVFSVALVGAAVLSGCRSEQQVAQDNTNHMSSATPTRVAHLTLPSGTSIDITLGTSLTSETARVGNAWIGTVQNASVVNGRNLIPAGSPVAGTVTGVTAAHKGNRAMLDLGLTSITVGDHRYRVEGSTEAVIAGSPRARNLGAIAAGTAAGALVGRAVSGSNRGTIVGGLIGGGAATGVVSQTRGWQVVLKEGTPLTFTTHEAVAVRL